MATTRINAYQQLGSSTDWSASGGGIDVIIRNVKTPVNGTDAVNKDYVDAMVSGLSIKNSVRVATTANITLSGTQTIDGVGVSVGDRVLVKNQTSPAQNGIYTVTVGSWTRSTDANDPAEVNNGMFTFVEEGTTQADSGWVLSTDGVIVLDTTPLTFVQFSGAGQVIAGAGLTKTGNTIDIVTVDSTRITINADSIDLGQPVIGSSAAAAIQKIDFDTYGRVSQKTNATLSDIVTTIGSGIPQYTVFAGPSGTATGSPSFRLLVVGDIPSLDTAKLTTGTLGVLRGGTGLTAYTLGDILYASATNVLSPLAGNTVNAKKFLVQTGTGTISAAPSWGTIVASDIGTGAALTKTDDTNVTLILGGTPAAALLAATSLTLGWTGQLSIARGGTGQTTALAAFDALAPTTTTGQMTAFGATTTVVIAPNTTTTKQYLSGTGTGTTGQVPVWATIDGTDITGAALTKVDDTNVTLTLGGIPATSLLRAASLTLGWTGTLATTRGGTGFGVYVVGDILYANTTTTLAKLTDVATGNALISGGVGIAPSYGKIGLTTHISGTLAIGNGGTGLATTPINGQLLIGNGTTYNLANITAGATNSMVINNGAGTISLDVNAAAAAVTTAWAGVTTGSIAIGGGLTSGTIGLGTATSTTTITGTIKFPTVGTTGFVKLGTGGILSYDSTTYAAVNKMVFRDSLSNVANPTAKAVTVWNGVKGSVGNLVYIWAATPIVLGSETIYINGILQSNGNDYTISGLAITFLTGTIPQTGDFVQVNYILT